MLSFSLLGPFRAQRASRFSGSPFRGFRRSTFGRFSPLFEHRPSVALCLSWVPLSQSFFVPTIRHLSKIIRQMVYVAKLSLPLRTIRGVTQLLHLLSRLKIECGLDAQAVLFQESQTYQNKGANVTQCLNCSIIPLCKCSSNIAAAVMRRGLLRVDLAAFNQLVNQTMNGRNRKTTKCKPRFYSQ